MKKIVLASLLVAGAFVAQTAMAQSACCQQNQSASQQQLAMMQGPGPAVAGSFDYNKLPDQAKKFVAKHFKGQKVMNVQKEFASGDYEVTMANGVEIEFNSKGEVVEIDGQNSALSATLVKAVVPKGVYSTLSSKAIHNSVKSIDFEKGQYKLEFVKNKNAKVKELKFDMNGAQLEIEYF